MKKSLNNLVRISAVLVVFCVCIVAEHVYFRLIEDSSSTDNCSDFIGRVGTAVTAVRCGADCSWNGHRRGFLYDHMTTVCKDVYRDILDPECQADGEADYYSEVCDQFLVTGPYGVADNQLDDSTNWCAIVEPNVDHCQPLGDRPTSAKYARLDSTGMYTGAWIVGVKDQHQHIEVDFKKPKIVTKVVIQARYQAAPLVIDYVTSFKFLYSDDCSAYEELTDDNGNTLIMDGNNNTYETVVRDLPRRVKARCFRINPVTWVRHIAMRFDLLGCP